MKILKNICHALGTFLQGVPNQDRAMARVYGLQIFAKTRYYSHMKFIKTCLENDIIPNGFKISSNDCFSSNHLSIVAEKAMATCSKRLMRITLKDFSFRIKYSSDKLTEAKEYFNRGNQDVFKSIQSKVHNLNLKLFKSLQDIKQKKLSVLMPSRPSPVQNRVIFIPESVELPDDQRDVLARGLRFIPTPRGINPSDVNFELERFYRRVKLHAFFNDQNRGFTDIRSDDVDDFSKYNRKPSNWTPSANPLCVDRFIDRCREVSNIHFDKQSSKRSNISSTERKALFCLKKRDDIVIKPADKGCAIVVWRKDLYIEEANRQL